MPPVNVITPGDRVRALRQLLGWTQDRLATASGIARTKVVEIETGANAATTWRIRKGLADAVGVRVETMADMLDGAVEPAEVLRRIQAGTEKAVVGRLRDRPEWQSTLAAAQAAAAVTDPDLAAADFERVGLLYDGEPIPKLTPRLILQLCRILTQ